ncbi:MAG TPA: response regulator [Turneriella sp.]|nr:response regulator [Turneriella sp.]HMY10368.1 response regulator [Turneriella sp.]HNE18732.1 response regulator [Turneriella sp.]HNJ67051.1 response regulator [Turneriella sp.]HNM99931.1 response regulator [Turneriella sp.]
MSRILAVDDSEPMRQMVEQTLRSGGHETVLAVDGKDALEKFRAGEFDLIITDINMPVMDGYEFTRVVREFDDQTPILALTTEGEQAKRTSGQEAGVDGWIVKPFKPAQFLAIVKQILE